MLSAIGLEKSYYEIIEMIVCSRKSKIFMICRCNLCPGIQAAYNFLMQFLKQIQEPEEDFESDKNEELTTDFKQWTTRNKTDLLTMKHSLNKFIELLSEKKNSTKLLHTSLLQSHKQTILNIYKNT